MPGVDGCHHAFSVIKALAGSFTKCAFEISSLQHAIPGTVEEKQWSRHGSLLQSTDPIRVSGSNQAGALVYPRRTEYGPGG